MDDVLRLGKGSLDHGLSVFLILILLSFPTQLGAQTAELPHPKGLAAFYPDDEGGLYVASGEAQDSTVPVTGEWHFGTPKILIDFRLPQLLSKGHQNARVFHIESPSFSRSEPAFANAKVEERITPAWLKGKRVLSLGEGGSGLTPYLRELGAIAHGLDTFYLLDLERMLQIAKDKNAKDLEIILLAMNSYLRTHLRHLYWGSATDLTNVQALHPALEAENDPPHRIENDSYDLVLSHRLLGYLDIEQQTKMVSEALRVTKPGGSVHLVMVLPEAQQPNPSAKDMSELDRLLGRVAEIGHEFTYAYYVQRIRGAQRFSSQESQEGYGYTYLDGYRSEDIYDDSVLADAIFDFLCSKNRELSSFKEDLLVLHKVGSSKK